LEVVAPFITTNISLVVLLTLSTLVRIPSRTQQDPTVSSLEVFVHAHYSDEITK